MVSVVAAGEAARAVLARLLRVPLARSRFGLSTVPESGSIARQLCLIGVGPVAAYLALATIAFGHFRCNTFQGPARNRIYWISTDYDAAGKLAPGDRIVEVDGRPFVEGAAELRARVNERSGARLAITVERDGARRTFEIEPRRANATWLIGVTLASEDTSFDTADALVRAFAYPWAQAATIVRAALPKSDDEADPGGPVRIVDEFRTAKPYAVAVLELALLLATYALGVIVLVDVVRMIVATTRRVRSRAAATSGP